ncbi:MAG: RNA polymerase sigma-54 factor, partial [Flavobacteriia bacterium]|nr:RNA polymerase sigma-54 factor [Flavobacteriia bacterium]
MKLIQLPTQALEERIQEEMEINPALEDGPEAPESQDELSSEWEDEAGGDEGEYDPMDDYLSDDEIPDYKLQANNYSADDESYEAPVVVGKDMSDLLKEQLSMRSLSPQKEALCKYLIGTLEDDGYLRRELVDIVDDLAFSMGIFIDVQELEAA